MKEIFFLNVIAALFLINIFKLWYVSVVTLYLTLWPRHDLFRLIDLHTHWPTHLGMDSLMWSLLLHCSHLAQWTLWFWMVPCPFLQDGRMRNPLSDLSPPQSVVPLAPPQTFRPVAGPVSSKSSGSNRLLHPSSTTIVHTPTSVFRAPSSALLTGSPAATPPFPPWPPPPAPSVSFPAVQFSPLDCWPVIFFFLLWTFGILYLPSQPLHTLILNVTLFLIFVTSLFLQLVEN